VNKLSFIFPLLIDITTLTKFTEHPTVSKPISKFKTMADAMMKAAQAALDGNDQYIEILAAQLKAARERKKILKEAVKREKAHYKEHMKAQKAGAVSAPVPSGGAAPKQRLYADNAQNRKLGRAGKLIPSWSRKAGGPPPLPPRNQ